MSVYSLEQVVDFYQSNPSFVRYVNMFKPRRIGARLRGCPALGDLRILIATYFENGEQPKKTAGRSRASCTMKFEGWTDAGSVDLASPDWAINVPLQPRSKFLELIERQVSNGSISEDYFETLSQIAEASEDTMWFGQFHHNDGGQAFFDHQFCMVEVIDGQVTFAVIVNGAPDDGLVLPDGWSKTYPNGLGLKGNAVCQLRWDISGEFTSDGSRWPTVQI